jgi:hypothetical protein
MPLDDSCRVWCSGFLEMLRHLWPQTCTSCSHTSILGQHTHNSSCLQVRSNLRKVESSWLCLWSSQLAFVKAQPRGSLRHHPPVYTPPRSRSSAGLPCSAMRPSSDSTKMLSQLATVLGLWDTMIQVQPRSDPCKQDSHKAAGELVARQANCYSSRYTSPLLPQQHGNTGSETKNWSRADRSAGKCSLLTTALLYAPV